MRNLCAGIARFGTAAAFALVYSMLLPAPALAAPGPDMSASFNNLPSYLRPGQAVSGIQLICTNTGTASANNPTCSPSVTSGAIIGLTCSPGVAPSLAAGASITCTFDFSVPGVGGGSDEPTTYINFTGQTGATNDVNGGADSNAGNNSVTNTSLILDAVDDSCLCPAGAVGQQINLAQNDQVPIGATWTIRPGATCTGLSMDPVGTLTYNAPVSGTCSVPYQVCAPAPNATVCDKAVFTSTANTGTAATDRVDVTTSVGTPLQIAQRQFDVPFAVRVSNVGAPTSTVFNVQADNFLITIFPGATTQIVPGSFQVTGSGASCSAPSFPFDGQGATALLSGTTDLQGGQSCLIRFTVRADYGTNPVPVNPLLQTVYASGTADNATANPGYTFPNGLPQPPTVASTTDVSTDATPLAPPGLAGAPAPAPAAPTTPAGDTPTPTPCRLNPQQLGVAKSVVAIVPEGAGQYRVTYSVVMANTGTVDATNVQLTDDLRTTFPQPVNVISAGAVSLNSGSATACVPNPGFSTTQPQLLSGNGVLRVGESCTLRFDVVVATNGQMGPFLNTALGSSRTSPPASPGGTPVGTPLAEDRSDSGSDPRGNNPGQPGDTGGSDDPTPMRVPAGVSGSVWLDHAVGTPGNRRRESTELGLPGWTVQALYPPGTQVNGTDVGGQVARTSGGLPAQATTGADGGYLMANLPAGSYDIRFLAPASTPELGAMYAMPVNGERGQAQAGSTLDTARRVLRVGVTDGMLLIEQSLPVEPTGVVYDSATRAPVAGATVSLLGSNGSPLPTECLLPGQQNQLTPSGAVAGFYRFDLLPGAAPACPSATTGYDIRITPPPTHRFPSDAIPPSPARPSQTGAAVVVANQPGPPQLTDSTNYHLKLNLGPGVAELIHNHVPLDPLVSPAATLLIEKIADRRQAQIGDIVTYTVRLRNAGLTTLPAGEVTDKLPLGFKAVNGSVTQTLGASGLTAPLPDSAIRGWPGPVLRWTLPSMAAGQEVRFTYRLRVNIGADRGDGTNRAQATSSTLSSNVAQVTVKVSGGVFGSEAQVIGKVYLDCNQNKLQDEGEWGIPGVRVVMQDGTSVTTDENGLFSFVGLRPMTHVLRIDPRTLPVGARLGTTSSRNMADPESLFIDLKNGELHRAEFREQSCFPKVMAQVRERRSLTQPVTPFNQTGKDAPWGIQFDSREQQLKRTPALQGTPAPAAGGARP